MLKASRNGHWRELDNPFSCKLCQPSAIAHDWWCADLKTDPYAMRFYRSRVAREDFDGEEGL